MFSRIIKCVIALLKLNLGWRKRP